MHLLYCSEEVKNVLGDILEMHPEKLNIPEIMQEDLPGDPMLLFASKSKVMNLFHSENHGSIKQLDLGLKTNYLFQGFLWLFWK